MSQNKREGEREGERENGDDDSGQATSYYRAADFGLR